MVWKVTCKLTAVVLPSGLIGTQDAVDAELEIGTFGLSPNVLKRFAAANISDGIVSRFLATISGIQRRYPRQEIRHFVPSPGFVLLHHCRNNNLRRMFSHSNAAIGHLFRAQEVLHEERATGDGRCRRWRRRRGALAAGRSRVQCRRVLRRRRAVRLGGHRRWRNRGAQHDRHLAHDRVPEHRLIVQRRRNLVHVCEVDGKWWRKSVDQSMAPWAHELNKVVGEWAVIRGKIYRVKRED